MSIISPIDLHISQAIKVRRQFLNLTQKSIAVQLSVSMQQLQKYENGQNKVSASKLIELSKKIKKPIIIHSRKAEQDVIDILENLDAKKVVLHCFSGKLKLIKRAAELGYYFSIPTNITHSQHFQKLAELVDINKILTETDAPYLSPYKNRRNEPSFITEAIKKIAEIKNISINEIANNIFMNYQNLFFIN